MCAVGRDAVLVRHVVVVAHDAVALQVCSHEEVVLVPASCRCPCRYSYISEFDAPAVVEVERQEAPGVQELGRP